MELEPIVHVVDDDPEARDAMAALMRSVDLEVVCHSSGKAFLDDWNTARPGCLLLDLRMPDMGGLELQAAIARRGASIPIIFITGHGKVSAAVRAMLEGAVDFLTKPVDDEALIARVHRAIEADRTNRRQQTLQQSIQARMDLLTPREFEVMEDVASGCTNKEIARRLQISPKTVELHRANMMNKMHAGSLAEELVRLRLQVKS